MARGREPKMETFGSWRCCWVAVESWQLVEALLEWFECFQSSSSWSHVDWEEYWSWQFGLYSFDEFIHVALGSSTCHELYFRAISYDNIEFYQDIIETYQFIWCLEGRLFVNLEKEVGDGLSFVFTREHFGPSEACSGGFCKGPTCAVCPCRILRRVPSTAGLRRPRSKWLARCWVLRLSRPPTRRTSSIWAIWGSAFIFEIVSESVCHSSKTPSWQECWRRSPWRAWLLLSRRPPRRRPLWKQGRSKVHPREKRRREPWSVQKEACRHFVGISWSLPPCWMWRWKIETPSKCWRKRSGRLSTSWKNSLLPRLLQREWWLLQKPGRKEQSPKVKQRTAVLLRFNRRWGQ